jgi:hypothetical protein
LVLDLHKTPVYGAETNHTKFNTHLPQPHSVVQTKQADRRKASALCFPRRATHVVWCRRSWREEEGDRRTAPSFSADLDSTLVWTNSVLGPGLGVGATARVYWILEDWWREWAWVFRRSRVLSFSPRNQRRCIHILSCFLSCVFSLDRDIPHRIYKDVHPLESTLFPNIPSTTNIHQFNHDADPPQPHHPAQNRHITLLIANYITYLGHLVAHLWLRSPQRPPRRRQLHGETPRNKCARGFLHDRRDVSSQAKARQSVQRRTGCV